MRVLSECALLLGSLPLLFSVGTAQQVCTIQHVTIQQLADADLRYQLIERFGPVRFCDPDCAGPCNFVRAQKHAEEAFTKIREDEKTFRLILEHLSSQKMTEGSPEQKGYIYGEYKKLVCGMSIEPHDEDRKFTFKAASGFRIEGLIKKDGEIVVVEKVLTSLICPK